MDATIARNIAHYGHAGQRTRRGLPRIEYVERVAAAVSEEARALAFLDDVLERTTTNVDELLANGLTAVESAALGYSCARRVSPTSCTCCASSTRAGPTAGSRGRSSSPTWTTTYAKTASSSATRRTRAGAGAATRRGVGRRISGSVGRPAARRTRRGSLGRQDAALSARPAQPDGSRSNPDSQRTTRTRRRALRSRSTASRGR
jgi:hypothetical protein